MRKLRGEVNPFVGTDSIPYKSRDPTRTPNYLQKNRCPFVITFLSFAGITGTVSIDENGDRNADYSLLDLNPTTGNFEVNITPTD